MSVGKNQFRCVISILIVFTLSLYCSCAFAYKVGTTKGNLVKWDTNYAYVYINTSGSSSSDDSHSAIVEAMRAWTNVSTSSFVFVPTQTSYNTATFPKKDGVSLVDFGKTNRSGVASVRAWYNTKTGIISECDMRFNTANYKFSTDGSSATYDIQNIATHEFGHWLQLLDLYDKENDYEKTMYGYVDLTETKKRDLHQDDIDGVTYLYP